MRALSLAVLVSITAASCGGRDASYDMPYQVLEPLVLGDALVFVETNVPRAHVVRVRPNRVSSFRVPIAPNPIVSERRRGPVEEVLILSRGTRDQAGVTPSPSTLTVLSRNPATAPRVYEIGNPFNALAQSEDGRYAIAYFQENAGADRFLFNPNEIAVVDLEAAPGADNPRLRTVRSFGGVPLGIAYSPPLRLAGREPRTLAVVYSRSYVTLLDLAHLERPEFTIRLTSANDARDLFPEQVLFRGGSLFVRCRNTTDIFEVSLRDRVDAPVGGNDYEPTLNALATNAPPSDMAIFSAEDGTPRLLVVSSSRAEASVVDPSAGRLSTFPLEEAATEIVLFEAVSSETNAIAPHALLLRSDDTSAIVSFVDLARIEDRGSRNVESLRLGASVQAVLPLRDRGLVLFLHGGWSAERVSVLDLEKRTVAPIYAEVNLSSAVVSPGRDAIFVQGWSDRLGFLDLETLRPGEIRLDAPIEAVVPLERAVDDRYYVATFHSGFGGRVTFIDVGAPERGEAFGLEGFLFDDLLDEGRGL